MLEFINIETVKGLILLLFSIFILAASFRLHYKKKKAHYKEVLTIVIVVIIIIPFIEAYNTRTYADKILLNFKKGNSFICKAGDKNRYRVSQEDGWSIDSIYFIKESLLIRTDKCEEQ